MVDSDNSWSFSEGCSCNQYCHESLDARRLLPSGSFPLEVVFECCDHEVRKLPMESSIILRDQQSPELPLEVIWDYDCYFAHAENVAASGRYAYLIAVYT